MGANMQRQAVPLVHPAAPYVGTGIEERRAALDSGEVTLAKNAGEVIFADAAKIIVKHAGGMDDVSPGQVPALQPVHLHQLTVRSCASATPLSRVSPWPTVLRPIMASSHWARTSPWHTCRGRL